MNIAAGEGPLVSADMKRAANFTGRSTGEQAPVQLVRHKVGCARTIRTAVLVTEYLRAHCCHPHSKVPRDAVSYSFTDASQANGHWSADIIVAAPYSFDRASQFVDTCRAFVAGAGEIW